jgi:lipid-A-disaccharide synthase
LTYMLGKPRVKVPRFAMVNLIAEKEVVPELVQENFTAANVVKSLREILPDGAARQQMIQGLRDVKARLRGSAVSASDVGSESAHQPEAAERAAEIVLAMVQTHRPGQSRRDSD